MPRTLSTHWPAFWHGCLSVRPSSRCATYLVDALAGVLARLRQAVVLAVARRVDHVVDGALEVVGRQQDEEVALGRPGDDRAEQRRVGVEADADGDHQDVGVVDVDRVRNRLVDVQVGRAVGHVDRHLHTRHHSFVCTHVPQNTVIRVYLRQLLAQM